MTEAATPSDPQYSPVPPYAKNLSFNPFNPSYKKGNWNFT